MPTTTTFVYHLKAARRTGAGCSEAGLIRGAPAPPAGCVCSQAVSSSSP
ncbi:MAG TPA: hypothetical protein VKX41_16750 [Alloacidobacterium sp.]|nr:hypothetical protein [Alloacidobacterium sp.]